MSDLKSNAGAPADFPLGLDEFCARLSATDKRIELIAGFHADATRAGTVTDTDNGFRALFAAFAIRPTL